MLIKHHLEYTKEALDGIHFKSNQKDMIKVGSIANDLCNLTNEFLEIFTCKADINLEFLKPHFIINSAIYQSHLGNLVGMHAMKRDANQDRDQTLFEIKLWLNFFNKIATGKIKILPTQEVRNSGFKLSALFENLNITFGDIFDSEDHYEIKYRAMGMMIHIIQDSFTQSHCERNKDDGIVSFFYYPEQDMREHKKNDDVYSGQKDKLIRICRKCLKSFANGSPFDYNKYFKLSNNFYSCANRNQVT